MKFRLISRSSDRTVAGLQSLATAHKALNGIERLNAGLEWASENA